MIHIKRINEFATPILEKRSLEEVVKYDDPAVNSLWNYVSGYTVGGINKDLRNGMMSRQLKEIVGRIDSLMEMESVKVYRTVDWDYMGNIYGITKDNIDGVIGRTFTAKGYTSTTRLFENVWGSSWTPETDLCMEITSNGKIGCIDVNSILPPEDIDCEEQEEVLLQRNLKFTINGYELIDNRDNIEGGDIHLLKVSVW